MDVTTLCFDCFAHADPLDPRYAGQVLTIAKNGEECRACHRVVTFPPVQPAQT